MIYEFEIQGNIVGKARPRMNTRTGKAYTPTKTKLYEASVRYQFLTKYPNFKPIKNRVRVTIESYFDIPKSTSKKAKEQMLNGNISPTKKPDADNIIKIILDAMNKFAFEDDTQVTELKITKKYNSYPITYIKIEEY